eukprot:c12715_g2_i1.p1 GENE.c12715_g2_i1~~c12715_g2_i1.p1  ORF type:complete len:338 (-),score=36.62 c12715_g2_i1:65-1078(-)
MHNLNESIDKRDSSEDEGFDYSVPPFIQKLFFLVDDPSLRGIVRWSDKGDGFYILDQSNLTQLILPRFFRHSNYQSFVRQLNLYGFHKTKQAKRITEFSHPHFRKGDKPSLKYIKRKGIGKQPNEVTSPIVIKSEVNSPEVNSPEIKQEQANQFERRETKKSYIKREPKQNEHKRYEPKVQPKAESIQEDNEEDDVYQRISILEEDLARRQESIQSFSLECDEISNRASQLANHLKTINEHLAKLIEMTVDLSPTSSPVQSPSSFTESHSDEDTYTNKETNSISSDQDFFSDYSSNETDQDNLFFDQLGDWEDINRTVQFDMGCERFFDQIDLMNFT